MDHIIDAARIVSVEQGSCNGWASVCWSGPIDRQQRAARGVLRSAANIGSVMHADSRRWAEPGTSWYIARCYIKTSLAEHRLVLNLYSAAANTIRTAALNRQHLVIIESKGDRLSQARRKQFDTGPANPLTFPFPSPFPSPFLFLPFPFPLPLPSLRSRLLKYS